MFKEDHATLNQNKSYLMQHFLDISLIYHRIKSTTQMSCTAPTTTANTTTMYY